MPCLDKIKVIWQLGLLDVIRYIIYSLKKRLEYYKITMRVKSWDKLRNKEHFFITPKQSATKNPYWHKISNPSCQSIIDKAEKILNNEFCFFFHHYHKLDEGFFWFYDPFRRNKLNQKPCNSHWSSIKTIDKEMDIKVIWEMSRFYWVITLAKAYVITANEAYINKLERLIYDWCKNNPINQGPNWVCGQEVSIRLIQVLLGWYILGENRQPSCNMIDFVVEHGIRIRRTMSYATAQRNNHITSEAAALYIAGCWLVSISGLSKHQKIIAKRWIGIGKKLLEKSVAKLVMSDGTFSQYSVNYHRLLLDTLSLVVIWQRHYKLREFSSQFIEKYTKAFKWLFDFVDNNTGNAPNIGNNDGGLFSNISDTDYRDFRASVQLAAVVITGRKCYKSGNYDDALFWLLPNFEQTLEKQEILDNTNKEIVKDYYEGGFLSYLKGDLKIFFRYPCFKFRPAQMDCFHIDIWINGENVLTDSGSYCYNQHICPEKEYFFGIASHNTVQFDNRQPMPIFSTFLFGGWLQSNVTKLINNKGFFSSYNDYKRAKHIRSVEVEENKIIIIDNVLGYETCAILRWNLANLPWHFQKNKYMSDKIQLEFFLNGIEADINKVKTHYSLYYLEQLERTTLEVVARSSPAEFRTIITYRG